MNSELNSRLRLWDKGGRHHRLMSPIKTLLPVNSSYLDDRLRAGIRGERCPSTERFTRPERARENVLIRLVKSGTRVDVGVSQTPCR
jgi:hypothetical protein